VGVKTPAGQEIVKDAAKLPAGAFQISTLDLSNLGRKVTDADLARFAGLRELKNLYLHGAPEVTDAGLAHLAQSPALEALVIGSTKVTGTGLVHTKNLLQLQMYGTPVSEAGLKRLAELTKLTHLNLNLTKVTDAQVAHLKSPTNLGHLDLSGTPLSDTGLEHLTGLSKLKFLYLKNVEVTNAGVQKLAAALPNCTIAWDGGTSVPKK
jgi:hypothetical protein